MNSKERSDHDASKVAKFLITDPIEIDERVNEPIRDLLGKYSSIRAEKTVEHVVALRDRAFQVFPYACIGQLRFLNLSLRNHPAYSELLERLTQGSQTLLDLGCCFAQDLRQLVQDGVPSERLYGVDIDQQFLDLGYELFLDKSSLKSTFLAVDVLCPDGERDLESVKGKIDVVWAASFLHLFNWDRQVLAATRIVYLLKPQPGSLVLGRQLGSVKPGPYDVMKDGRWQYRHDVETFKRFWEEVGTTTGTKWRVEASLDEVDFGYAQNKGWGDPDMRRLLFAVYME